MAGSPGRCCSGWGAWSTGQSRSYISKQEELRPATRELATKAAEITIFGISFIILMNIMGVNLSTLAVLGGAIGVGIGFGLQQIASNFISGVILLLGRAGDRGRPMLNWTVARPGPSSR